MNKAAYARAYRIKRKELGLCLNCDGRAVSSCYCAKHREEVRLRQKEKRLKRIRAGLCVHCSEPLGAVGGTWCLECLEKHRVKRSKTSKYSSVKGCAKSRSIPFLLSKKTFDEWHESQKRECYYCGVSEEALKTVGRSKSCLTVDRMDNERGYEEGNIVLACHRCNNLKSNFFTANQWLEVATKYIRPELKKYHDLG